MPIQNIILPINEWVMKDSPVVACTMQTRTFFYIFP